MSKVEQRLDRLNKANELIETIANGGRKFFRHQDRVARFELDDRQRLWLIDHWTQRRYYLHLWYWRRRFTHGGTLTSLAEELRDYVLKGKQLYPNTLGPWPQSCCEGDLWGYGEYMEVVRSKARELGIIQGEKND